MLMFAGADVSKGKVDLGLVRNIDTGKRKSKVFENTEKGHVAVVDWLLKNTKEQPENIVVTLEPTNVYHEALMYHLHDKGFKIFLANPSKARKYADSIGITHKTDKIDAFSLAFFGHARQQRLKYWVPEALSVRVLKALMRRSDALEKDLQRELNRQDSFEFCATSEHVSQSLQDMIEIYRGKIIGIKDEINKHIDRDPTLKKNRWLLGTIKGIGPVLSREMTYLFASKSFETAKQAAAYLGLIPRFNESGKMKGRTTLSKMGPARIRAKLYMAAVVASTHNKDIVDQKERLIAAGKTKMQALGAAMRKLVHICFGVVNSQTEYRSQVT